MVRQSVPCMAVLAALLCHGETTGPDPSFLAPGVPPRAQYTMDARLTRDGSAGTLALTEAIRFTNDTGRAIGRLAIAFPTGDYEQMEISVGGEPVAFLPGDTPPLSESPALIELPSPLAPGETVQLDIAFARHVYIGGETMQITLRDWYPRLWWGFPTHDDYDVGIEAPPIWAVGTSGLRDHQTGRYVITGAKDFGVFLGRGYKVMEADAGGVQIRAIHAQAAEDCARLLVDTAVDAVNFYRERFGSYPHPNLTIVPGSDRPMGGYPVAAAMVAVHGQRRMEEKEKLHWRWITAHEIGHMYWGEHVLEKDSPGWLWIGLGIYADREYTRARDMEPKKHDALRNRYIGGVTRGLDTTLALSPEAYDAVDFDYNNVCIHGKGFSVISALAWLLGQETFDRAYIRCLNEFSGRRLGAAEFQKVCEEESGQDLAWFFDQWVRSNRYLMYKAGQETCAKRGDTYASQVKVKCVGTLKMPVPVAAYFGDGSVQVKRTERLLDVNTLTFESAAPLERVRLDPDRELAMASPPTAAAQDAGKAIRDLDWTGSGDEALELFPRAKEAELSDPDLWAKLGMTLYDGKHYSEALEAFERAGDLSGEGDSWHFAAMAWQGQVLDVLGRRDEAIQRYQEALERDTGRSMRHDQYDMVLDRGWVEERLERPFEPQ
jgi:Peptidase family M1 domain